MPASSGEMLNPSSLVIPDYSGVSPDKMELGAIFFSGAKLYFVDVVGSTEKITSAAAT